MARLSEEFLEEVVTKEKTAQKVRIRIDQELKLLVEETAQRHTR